MAVPFVSPEVWLLQVTSLSGQGMLKHNKACARVHQTAELQLNCSCAAHLGEPGAMHPIPNTCTDLCSSVLCISGTYVQIILVSYRSLRWPNVHVQLQHQHENCVQLLQAKVHAPIRLKGGYFIISALLYHPFNWNAHVTGFHCNPEKTFWRYKE